MAGAILRLASTECTNLLFDDIRTLTPENDIQSSDRQARDQECGTQRESNDRRHLPTDEPPCSPEHPAGSLPTKVGGAEGVVESCPTGITKTLGVFSVGGFGRFTHQLWQRK